MESDGRPRPLIRRYGPRRCARSGKGVTRGGGKCLMLLRPPLMIWATAVCGKSYVHETVVNAFEEGALEQFANMSRGPGSGSRSEKVLAEVTEQIATDFAA